MPNFTSTSLSHPPRYQSGRSVPNPVSRKLGAVSENSDVLSLHHDRLELDQRRHDVVVLIEHLAMSITPFCEFWVGDECHNSIIDVFPVEVRHGLHTAFFEGCSNGGVRKLLCSDISKASANARSTIAGIWEASTAEETDAIFVPMVFATSSRDSRIPVAKRRASCLSRRCALRFPWTMVSRPISLINSLLTVHRKASLETDGIGEPPSRLGL
ncbi:hypothetical protein BU25DRAFT_31610 [Macroventuria anomochaeta]|uniref:Uncharacterized protein n=1 Tax=Macroventuria anomochaeta TaxID=301207 RepID=A0ACB6S475_9PLEO|nr:uncharacterized protein BU25DRAFT_31610 [Macroventuria anomochaeta]KAF2628753.1 hypothetical protein BU25DRAFT_31610 [Macroventuria anomochaeta]